MPSLAKVFDSRDGVRRDERRALLPIRNRRQEAPSAIPAEDVTKIALKLKYQIETVIPCELPEDSVTRPHSTILTQQVIETARGAGGDEHKSCVIYCLLICKKWFRRLALLELWDADLHYLRATACEMLAKRIIESEEDEKYLFEQLLLKRFATKIDGEDTETANAIEKAVDLHALTVIGSSGYQKAINYLWRGWLVQDDEDPTRFVPYENKTNTSYWAHLDPDRMRVPRYQNALQIFFTVAYLVLYTVAVNTQNPNGYIRVPEAIMYVFTLGFICDEAAKFWKVGRYYVGFWNVFNSTLYSLLIVTFVLHMVAHGFDEDSYTRTKYTRLAYNFLSFTAPMFWMRLLLYFDTFRFFGSTLVVVKVMMKESIIFFALLFFVLVGFWQAFVGMDLTDQQFDAQTFIVKQMLNAIMQSPEFGDEWEDFSHPFGLIMYYIYTFVVMVVLLNILIALYGSAYEDITSNAIDEYMALFAGKCLQFVRAPDENVFIPPFNLIELVFLVLPFEWWLSKSMYERLNDAVMFIIYTPLLVITAFIEVLDARWVRDNRSRGETDEDTIEEWEQLDWNPENEDETWVKKVQSTAPNVEVDGTLLEVRRLKEQLDEMKEMLQKVVDARS